MDCVIQRWPSAWIVFNRFSVIFNRRRRKGLFIDLSNESKFTYVKRVFDER